ncbi:MAG: hypothetical protein Kow0032_11520 [Methyloligellaceae bacterium]
MGKGLRWQKVEAGLMARKREIEAEIAAYPAPIPACDAQFNHLLEMQRLVRSELQRLELARREAGESTQAVAAFLANSRILESGQEGEGQ